MAFNFRHLGVYLSVADKAALGLLACIAPALVLFFMLGHETSLEQSRIARERAGVAALQHLGVAEMLSARFLRMGAFESDLQLLEDALTEVRATQLKLDFGPSVAAHTRQAIASFEAAMQQGRGGRADAVRQAMLSVDALGDAISEASALKYDGRVELRLANAIRTENAPAIGARLETVRRRLDDRPIRHGALSEALGLLDEARMNLTSSAADSPPSTLATEIGRLDSALGQLVTQANLVEVRRADASTLARAWRDASASLETVERASLEAMDQTLAVAAKRASNARAATMTLALVVIGVFLVLGYIIIRRGLVTPIRKLLQETAVISTSPGSELDPRLQEREDEIGQMARFLAAANEFAKAQIEAEAIQRSARRVQTDRNNFVTTMTHELRTPLNAIIGYTEMLCEDAGARNAAEDAEDLQRILAAARHLLHLINDILDFSVVESGETELALEHVDPYVLLCEATRESTALALANGATISALRPAREIAPITTDRRRLKQCLSNLTDNAAKFTRGGTVETRVEEYVRDGARALRFVITDNGMGISEQQLKRLFEPFSQADESKTRAHGGTGLGLALTQRLARTMGGDVTVQSQLGKGSIFTLWLPAIQRGHEAAPPAALSAA